LSVSDPEVVQRCLWNNVLSKLTTLLYQSNSTTIKEALWAFSNITAGPVSHCEQFIDSDAFDRVMVLTESRNIDVRKESLFVICNTITSSDLKTRAKLFEKTNGSVIKTMILASNLMDLRLILNVIESIECLLKLDDWYGWGQTDKSVALLFERYGGLDSLDELLKHPSMDVYNKCNEILLKYFEQAESMDISGAAGGHGHSQSMGGVVEGTMSHDNLVNR